MAIQNSQVLDSEIVEVDFANVFQEATFSSKVLNFKSSDLRNKILEADSKQLLVVTSSIDSPKTVSSVEDYDRAFLEKSL